MTDKADPTLEFPKPTRTLVGELTRIPVLVAALGYLVDMYDLFLFNSIRVPSLRSLHLSGWKKLFRKR